MLRIVRLYQQQSEKDWNSAIHASSFMVDKMADCGLMVYRSAVKMVKYTAKVEMRCGRVVNIFLSWGSRGSL